MSSYFNIGFTGQVGVNPRRVQILTSDSLAVVTAAGWINSKPTVEKVLPTDIIDMIYLFSAASGVGIYSQFTVSITAGVTTLVQYVSPGDVTLPVVSGDIAVFDGTTGKIKDSGLAPSAAAAVGITKVASVSGPTSINAIASFSDTSGTIKDAGATTISHLGPIQAGATNGTGQGIFIAASPTSSRGSFQIRGSNNTGNTDTTFTNAPMAQTTTISVADPGQATGISPVQTATITSGDMVKAGGSSGLLVTAGYNQHQAITATWGGGGTTNNFIALDISPGSIVIAMLHTATNVVAFKAIAGAGTLDVTFAADPGAGTSMSYIVLSAAA